MKTIAQASMFIIGFTVIGIALALPEVFNGAETGPLILTRISALMNLVEALGLIGIIAAILAKNEK